jgi:type I restriction enzyme S subunit
MKPYASYKPSGVPWLGDVPAHWAGKRLRDCVEGCSNGIWGDDPDGGDDDIPVIRVADFDRTGRQVVEYETLRKVDSGQRGSRALIPGDMLMEKSGGGEQQPVGMVVSYFGPEGAVCSNFVARMRSREGVVSRFMVYLHAFLYASRVTSISVKQTTGIQNLDSTAYLSEACFVPPPVEQQAIANYLDVETARIDTLINEKDELIELLREARASVVDRAVQPHQTKAVPLKRYVRGIATGPFGSALHAEDYVSGGPFLINPTHIVDGKLVPDSDVSLSDEAAKALSSYRFNVGDIVVGRRGEMGRCAVIPGDGDTYYCGTGCLMLFPDTSRVVPAYLSMVISSTPSKDWLSLESVGSTMENLNSGILGRLPCFVPSIDEQQSLLESVLAETAAYDSLRTYVQEEITLLKELRAATIADAVLGRIDVRGSAKTIASCA